MVVVLSDAVAAAGVAWACRTSATGPQVSAKRNRAVLERNVSSLIKIMYGYALALQNEQN